MLIRTYSTKPRPNGYNGLTFNYSSRTQGGAKLKRNTRFFYFIGGLISVLAAWLGIETPWNQLSEEIAFSMFLNLIIASSLGVTKIAVGWLEGLNLEGNKS